MLILVMLKFFTHEWMNFNVFCSYKENDSHYDTWHPLLDIGVCPLITFPQSLRPWKLKKKLLKCFDNNKSQRVKRVEEEYFLPFFAPWICYKADITTWKNVNSTALFIWITKVPNHSTRNLHFQISLRLNQKINSQILTNERESKTKITTFS